MKTLNCKLIISFFALATLLAGGFCAHGQILTPLYQFTDGADGSLPNAHLIQANDGNFYGTTSTTAFRISSTGNFSILYDFTGGGNYPYAGLIQGNDGSFYGVSPGGTSWGSVFKISQAGELTVLHRFAGAADGGQPYGVLVQGTDGSFYGTTKSAGTNGYGTVFKVTSNGTFTVLHHFSGGADGGESYAGLVQGRDGNFYGTTSGGGGCGTIFKITPSGTLTTLHQFICPEGGPGFAGLCEGRDGNFYGTTWIGNTVFMITPTGRLTTLHEFHGSTDGGDPRGGVIQGNDGNFYGTTEYGGAYGAGTIFKISSAGTFTALYHFTGGADGARSIDSLVQGSDGDLYGTTEAGGYTNNYPNGWGTVFRFSIPSTPLTIATTSPLPSGTVATTYNQQLTATGGTGTYTWSVVSNSLPSGLGLVSSTGMITGTPTVVTTASFRVRVTDSSPTNQVAEKDFTLTINPTVPTRVIGLSGSLTFGSVPVGAPTTGTLTIANSGNSSLTVSNITYSSNVFKGAFTGSIAAGGATNVTVTFTPIAAVAYNATVTVYSDKTSGANTIAATGTGIVVPTKIIGLTGNLTFGNVPVNTTVSRTLTIANSGNMSLTVTNISYPYGFSGNWHSGTMSIAAGGSQNVLVSFTPTTTNNYGGTISVSSDATSGTGTINVSGTGVDSPVITTPGLPLGRVGGAYSQSLTATGGAMPYTWSWAGNLPPGLTLSSTTSSNATVSGIPSTAGLFNFTMRVTGNNGVYSEEPFSLAINTLLTAPVAVTNAMAQVGGLTIVPAGEGIVFTVGTTNLGAAVSVLWDFGDGTTVTNANPTHTFANCGSYTVTAAVTDGISTNTDHSSVTVPCQLQLIKAQARLNFAKGNGDSLSFTATLDLGTGFSAAGKAVTLDIGGAQLTYTLDGKGRYVGAQGTVKLAYSKSKKVWTLTAKLKSGNWQDAWKGHGLKNEDVAGAPVTLPVVVLIGDEVFAAEKSLTYTAKKGKSGLGR